MIDISSLLIERIMKEYSRVKSKNIFVYVDSIEIHYFGTKIERVARCKLEHIDKCTNAD